MLQTAADEMGLARPTDVSAATGLTRQLLAQLNATMEECIADAEWAGQEAEFVIEIGSPTVVSATLVSGSANVTIADTSPFASTPTAFVLSGTGIQTGARIVSVTSSTVLVMSETAEASGVVTATIVRDTFAVPDDYQRAIPSTQWDRRNQWALIGPQTPQLDQWQRSGIPVPVPRFQYRIIGQAPTMFRIYPPPSDTTDYPGTLVSEYISKYGVLDGGGSPKEFFTANTDVSRAVPDRVLIMGAKWRFRQAKGFDYADLQAEYYNILDSRQATSTGERDLQMSSDLTDFLVSPWNVRDGSFPGT